MKSPLPQIKVENSLAQPPRPTGYCAYTYFPQSEDIRLVAKVSRIADLKEICKARGLTPLDVLVFRTFSDSEDHKTFLFVNEIAFSSVEFEKVGPFIVEREAWSWEAPQPVEEKPVEVSPSWTLYGKIFWLSQILSVFKSI